MTSIPIATLIAEGAPLTPPDWTEEKEREAQEKRRRVAEHYAALFSSSPLWRRQIANDPKFFTRHSLGLVR